MTTYRPAWLGLATQSVLTALLLGFPGTAQAQTSTVSDVAVVGNVVISRDVILGVTSTKVGEPFSVDKATRDVAAIRDLGYFQRVAHREETTPTGLRVIFDVVENPKVTDIRITGNTLIPTATILETLTTKVGDVLNVARFGKDLDRVQELFTTQGYLAYVDIDQTNYITSEGVLTIPIKEVTIEEYRVVGNKKTKTRVIMREIRTPIGAPFSRNRLAADRDRLYNLGIVEDVMPRVEPGTENDKVKVILEVREKRTGQVELGFGYSSQQGLIGRAGLSEANFRGTGTAVSLSGEVGGRYRSAGVPPLSVELNYYQPWLDSKRTSLSASLYNRTTYRFSSNVVGSSNSSDAYEVRRGGSVGATRPLSGPMSLHLSLRSDSIKTYSGEDDDLFEYSGLDTRRDSTVTSLGSSLLYDTRDTPFDPGKGVYWTMGAETGYTRLSGSEATLDISDEASRGAFIKPALDYRRYIPLAKRKDIREVPKALALRVKTGFAGGPLSFFDQYFVGGADSLRGYPEDRFWGKNMLLMNLEYRFPVADSLQAVLFADAGDAWGTSLQGNPAREAAYQNWSAHGGDIDGDGVKDPAPDRTIYDVYEFRYPQHDSFKLHGSVGLGVRVKTPIGAIRLDYGISKEGTRTHFSIGPSF